MVQTTSIDVPNNCKFTSTVNFSFNPKKTQENKRFLLDIIKSSLREELTI